MKAQRKQRLILIGYLFLGAAAVVGFLLLALEENVNLFYPPDKIVSGEAPVDKRIRAGGMVKEGSVKRSDSHGGDGLEVRFTLSDLAGADFDVLYTGILPDLFREGQGIVATGKLDDNGVFLAEQVLAKHDENYMPPELANMAQNSPGAADETPGGMPKTPTLPTPVTPAGASPRGNELPAAEWPVRQGSGS